MKNYSAQKIKRYIFFEIILFGLVFLAIIPVHISNKFILKVCIISLIFVLAAAHFYFIYKNIYLPNLELQKLVDEYRKNEELKVNYKGDVKDNLIQEVQEIILSLDTIAIQ